MPPEKASPEAALLCKSGSDFLLASSGNVLLGESRQGKSKKKLGGGEAVLCSPQQASLLRFLLISHSDSLSSYQPCKDTFRLTY